MDILDLFGGNTDREDGLAEDSVKQMLANANNIESPEFGQYIPDLYEYQGDLKLPGRVDARTIQAPEKLEYESVGPSLSDISQQGSSAFNDIEIDPRLAENQMAALAGLEGIASAGGMTGTDIANLERIQGEVGAADRGRREAILQNMQMRGQGGGGLELLAQLQSGQDATNAASQAGLDIAGTAQDRALEALMAGGQLSGSIRGQQFGEQASKAEATDAINRFNAANMQSGNQFNAGQTQQSGQFNASNMLNAGQFNIGTALDTGKFNASQGTGADMFNAGTANDAEKISYGARQDTRNANVDLKNAAQQQNTFGTRQQEFSNNLSKTGMQNDSLNVQTGFYTGLGDRKSREASEKFGAVVGGGTKLAGAGIGAM
jgi:hypothetical protein